MDLITLSWFLLIPNVISFEQNEYKVIFERMEVVSFNTSYVGFAKSHNFKYNRTNAATILTTEIKVAMGNEVKVEVQAYKMASNEYREFPLRFMFDYCHYAAMGEGGLNGLYACGNSTVCPFRKGIYRSCAWAPNSNRFPPNIPSGNYMAELKFYYGDVDVLLLQAYFSIKYAECKGCWF